MFLAADLKDMKIQVVICDVTENLFICIRKVMYVHAIYDVFGQGPCSSHGGLHDSTSLKLCTCVQT